MNGSGAIRCLQFTEGKNFICCRPFFVIKLTNKLLYSVRLDQQYLLIGSEDGTFSVATDPEARWRSFNAALQKTPILGSGI